MAIPTGRIMRSLGHNCKFVCFWSAGLGDSRLWTFSVVCSGLGWHDVQMRYPERLRVFGSKRVGMVGGWQARRHCCWLVHLEYQAQCQDQGYGFASNLNRSVIKASQGLRYGVLRIQIGRGIESESGDSASNNPAASDSARRRPA